MDSTTSRHLGDGDTPEARALRQAEAELVAGFAEDDFEGPSYRAFVKRLAAGTIGVLEGWVISGAIFKHVKDLCGRQLYPTAAEMRLLRDDLHHRTRLVDASIDRAIVVFTSRAMRRGEWHPDGGAALQTYFTGAAILAFKDEFPKWRRHRQAELRLQSTTRYVSDQPTHAPDTARLAAASLELRDTLAQLSPRDRQIAWMVGSGYTHAEIAGLLKLPSKETVRGVMSRVRNKMPT